MISEIIIGIAILIIGLMFGYVIKERERGIMRYTIALKNGKKLEFVGDEAKQISERINEAIMRDYTTAYFLYEGTPYEVFMNQIAYVLKLGIEDKEENMKALFIDDKFQW